MINGLQVTGPIKCNGGPSATACCKPAADKFKKAFDILARDKENVAKALTDA